ncbi:hypothetical protein A2574_03765 [Candidatus Shapirobacteria bacterium RIFOXYD1_FULL_38_32]|uniref:Histidine triad (HIT) protein n=3 Tax=Candidatus Shapironibacteriota TaxID=1752721 RepID=A0A0G0MXR0_9BACT|nr:MAG: Histidine triad (HIT) protein [Candidatus Shapirobacteria bacterium GW2011_GWE2_38_30]KKQ90908.1 MAG: Histidine triad (HIT) protein [Candidatus Shapirobacteria bacterium GW2011_GWE1_38_92]OGL55985.1 MAG: hypothetical protein A2195_01840 [Candidatus Shapirobacteria bacterium RIFOXYA1_FULL_39_17]OGL56173.1 MAG: hypothetical protein A2367_01535 [Candidatus Shapirobacteria bacterium RIFOXYB1_FULL_38_38]OGL56802.1 MAG: hypothetical protein A2410_00225 [Candidatus Shapirobacteria bacterium RI
MSCYACDHPDTNTLNFVTSSDHWNVFLNNEQACLGRMVVVAKRHVPSLGELTQQEQLDFFKLVKILEDSVKTAFGASLSNWSCLMNDAYQEEDPRPHVHWHLRPRYKNNVELNGQTFSDPEFGHHYSRERKFNVDDITVKIIVDKIKSAIIKNSQ